MKEDSSRGKVLLVDSDREVIAFLKKCAEQSGYDVSTLSSLKRIGETVPLFRGIKLDLVAVSSVVISHSPEALPILRQVLECPVVVYNNGPLVAQGGVKASWLMERLHHSDSLPDCWGSSPVNN